MLTAELKGWTRPNPWPWCTAMWRGEKWPHLSEPEDLPVRHPPEGSAVHPPSPASVLLGASEAPMPKALPLPLGPEIHRA